MGLSSQDLLSTTQIGVGYTYNQAERAGNAYALLSYQGLYPIIDVSFQRGTRRTSLYVDRIQPLDSLRSDSWQYNQLTAGFRLPLQLTNSKYSQTVNLSAFYSYLQVTGYDLPFRYATEVGIGGVAQCPDIRIQLFATCFGRVSATLLRAGDRPSPLIIGRHPLAAN